ncbi:hypothetical protein Tco_0776976 [Tanacetum coccineum]
MYKINQRKVRDNPLEYFLNHGIVKVVRFTDDQQHGLDYMEQIIVMRENDKQNSFLEADFKYLNKNDIEDIEQKGLIYLYSKEEKRVMNLVEIVKFCDDTLERVLKEVKLKIFETEFLKKAQLLGELDLNIMKAYEREITKRLRHREQMRRWESFPSKQDHGCGYFKWKDEITFGNACYFPEPSTPSISSSRASSSSGLSGAALSPGSVECSNYKILIMKIKIVEARLAMERHPDDHPCQSAAILHELLNEMENLRVEAKEEDLKVARMISKLCVKLSAEIKEHRMFTQELDVSPGWVIIKGKTTEFLQELAERDEERVRQLQALARETEERAEEKMEFIEKLKGNKPF